MSVQPLSQLMPFNEHRFDACLTYLSKEYGKTLTQYDMVKLHVMIDVFHVLEYGRPVIGGRVQPWEHGPVVRLAYNRIMQWWHTVKETGKQPEKFHIEHLQNKKIAFTATTDPDFDDLSETEIEAMERAWKAVMTKNWESSQAYFHDPSTFMGRAWSNASAEGRSIDWDEIIDAYDELTGENHSHVKRMIRL